MNRDQRQILDALDALGWKRPPHSVGGNPGRELGEVCASVHACRTVHVLRWRERHPNGGGTLDGIEYVHPLYGRGWHTRTARIVHALATSKRSPRELGILLHALGGGGRSREPLGWRNVYAVGEGDDLTACMALADAGMMTTNGHEEWHVGTVERLTMFKVTTLGAAEVGVVP